MLKIASIALIAAVSVGAAVSESYAKGGGGGGRGSFTGGSAMGGSPGGSHMGGGSTGGGRGSFAGVPGSAGGSNAAPRSSSTRVGPPEVVRDGLAASRERAIGAFPGTIGTCSACETKGGQTGMDPPKGGNGTKPPHDGMKPPHDGHKPPHHGGPGPGRGGSTGVAAALVIPNNQECTTEHRRIQGVQRIVRVCYDPYR
jgi:hypothetical protein